MNILTCKSAVHLNKGGDGTFVQTTNSTLTTIKSTEYYQQKETKQNKPQSHTVMKTTQTKKCIFL